MSNLLEPFKKIEFSDEVWSLTFQNGKKMEVYSYIVEMYRNNMKIPNEQETPNNIYLLLNQTRRIFLEKKQTCDFCTQKPQFINLSYDGYHCENWECILKFFQEH
jgi:hypothetical protein